MRWWVVAVLGALAGCSLFRGPDGAPPVRGGVQQGVASWYGPGFHGRRTANGEIYDQEELTAAHPSLPHGTRCMVTNLDNGRAVEVRINDRGPFVGGRVIDLSKAAARSIGMIGPGIANVRVEVLDPGSGVALASAPGRPLRDERRPAQRARAAAPAAAATVEAPEQRVRRPAALVSPPEDFGSAAYTVQVATLTDELKAQHLAGRLRRRFAETRVTTLSTADRRYYQVEIGPYPLRTVAVAQAEVVSRLGWPAVIAQAD